MREVIWSHVVLRSTVLCLLKIIWWRMHGKISHGLMLIYLHQFLNHTAPTQMAAAVAILFLSSVSVCPDGILSKHYIWRVETARWHSGTSPTRHAPTQYGGGG